MLKELQERYKAILAEAETIRLKFAGKLETMTAEDDQRWTALMDEADTTQKRIETAERETKHAEWAQKSAGMLTLVAPKSATETTDDDADALDLPDHSIKAMIANDPDAKLKMSVFRQFLTQGYQSLKPAQIKALQADNPTTGGFLIAPMQFVMELLSNVRDVVVVRRLARTFTVTKSESIGVPTLDTFMADADWTQELATGGEDSSLAFGRRELTPHPVAKRIKLSNKLIRQSAFDVDAIVREQMSYKFGITEEKAFLTGTGNNQPLGVFTSSAFGISTARDVTAASTTAINADDLINMKYSLKMQYHARARWIIHRDTLKNVRKLKDGDGNYIWASGLGPGQGFQGTPPSILDLPYEVSEYAPNTYTTGLYVAILGDFNFYWIVDALDMQIQVLDQLYAETNQTGYIGRRELDGMPTLEEPFARLKLA